MKWSKAQDIWQNRERRTNVFVLAALVWAPLWIILGLAAGPPVLYGAVTLAALPFAIAPFMAIGVGLLHGNLVGRFLLVAFLICAVSVAYLIG